jgi:hypothetical protein
MHWKSGRNLRSCFFRDKVIRLQSVKLNDSGDLVLRILNPCKESRRFTLELLPVNIIKEVEIGSKKLKTLVWEKASGGFIETDLPEKI